jgi:hypothetical protein
VSNALGLVAFPRLVRQLAEERGRETLATLLPTVSDVSWLVFLVGGLAGASAYRAIFAVLGMNPIAGVTLWVLLFPAVCLNAHANLAYEFAQATAAFRRIGVLGLAACVVLVGVFFLLAPRVGAVAIGFGWIASQITFAVGGDAIMRHELGWKGSLARFTLARLLTVALLGVGCFGLTYHRPFVVGASAAGLLAVLAGALLRSHAVVRARHAARLARSAA